MREKGERLFIDNVRILSIDDKIGCIVWGKVECIESVPPAQTFFFLSSLPEFSKFPPKAFFVEIPAFINKIL